MGFDSDLIEVQKAEQVITEFERNTAADQQARNSIATLKSRHAVSTPKETDR